MTAGQDLIYDWNLRGASSPAQAPELDDETLRDGLQSPSVRTPAIEDKVAILHLMADLGIQAANLGLPGAGPHVEADVLALAREIVDEGLPIYPNCAARTLRVDIEPVVRVKEATGLRMEVSTFIGSSPIRQYAEGWTLERMVRHSEEAVSFAVENGLDVMFVTEDTTRAHPDDLKALYGSAIAKGAKRICLCDTVGHATPPGVRALVGEMRAWADAEAKDIKLDWHGHRDRGLDVWNTMAAIEAGADRVHGTALGIGERVGNTPMDQILVNLRLLGWIDTDLSRLGEYCALVSKATGVAIPPGYPVVGKDAFRTGTGVHAAAVIKAQEKGDAWLADRIYSSVPASDFGLCQVIEVGPLSGKSNVIHWLNSHGHEATEERVERIFAAAKVATAVLSDERLTELC